MLKSEKIMPIVSMLLKVMGWIGAVLGVLSFFIIFLRKFLYNSII